MHAGAGLEVGQYRPVSSFCSLVDCRIGFSGTQFLSTSAQHTFRRSVSLQFVTSVTCNQVAKAKSDTDGFLRKRCFASNVSPQEERCESFFEANHTNKTTDLGRTYNTVFRCPRQQSARCRKIFPGREASDETTNLKSTNKNHLRNSDSGTAGLTPDGSSVSRIRIEQKTTYYEKRNVDQHVSNRRMSDCDRGGRPTRRAIG